MVDLSIVMLVYQRVKKLVFFPNSPTHPNSSAASGKQVVPDVVPVWVLGWLRLRLDSCSLAAVTLSYHFFLSGIPSGFFQARMGISMNFLHIVSR